MGNRTGDVGFLRDQRRTNVLLTRARRGLLVLGDAKTLLTKDDTKGGKAARAKAERSGNVWGPWLRWVESKGGSVSADDLHHLLDKPFTAGSSATSTVQI